MSLVGHLKKTSETSCVVLKFLMHLSGVLCQPFAARSCISSQTSFASNYTIPR